MPHTSSPCLAVQSLTFSYPERHVFTRWSGQFGPGMSWLQGHNGCGKSTLLKLLAGAVAPSGGHIRINEVDQAAQAMAYRQRVFWCGPGAIPFEHLTPWQYWGFMRSLYPMLDEDALRLHADAFGLAPHLGAPLQSLSTGTQRKVWVSAALAAHTTVTLIDEPFNALDADSLAHLRQALVSAAQSQDRIWVLTSHEDLGPASQWARRLDLSTPGHP
jgi:ABC-2 type transport system ATP-binding protein